MNASDVFKGLSKAIKAQAEVDEFFKDVDKHFTDLGVYQIGFTYCAGDGFLITDGRGRGNNLVITKEIVNILFSFKTAEEVYSYVDSLGGEL